jgi:sporadic carbohydrate cluster 2OG-Fe(II) oxygenase
MNNQENIANIINNGPGYAVLPIEDMQTFEQLRNTFMSSISENIDQNKKGIDNIRESMIGMSKSEINKLMLNLMTQHLASEILVKSCKNLVTALSGSNLFIQRRANFIINIPGSDQRRQWPHYELMSGISPFTYVIWAPLHDLDDGGGIYYLNASESLKIMRAEHQKGLVNGPEMFKMLHNRKALNLKYGEVVIFNPFILHGNSDFESRFARIACSVRFQSALKPLMQKNTDYFRHYTLKDFAK